MINMDYAGVGRKQDAGKAWHKRRIPARREGAAEELYLEEALMWSSH